MTRSKRGALQRTPAWYEQRRTGVTSTDIPAILGLSPWKSEGDVAREKLSDQEPEVDPKSARRMRLGQLLEPVVRAEDELEHGVRLRAVRSLVVHPTIPWAIASLDFERVGERCIVEAKSSRSGRWDDGLPRDIEAQVRWQMGVADYPRAHVALLRGGADLQCYDVTHDPELFGGLVSIAADFRARLDAGGPFAETTASINRKWPQDTGAEMDADEEAQRMVDDLLALRGQRDRMREQEEVLETGIKDRMGEIATLYGRGWKVTWRRTRAVRETDWRALANDLLEPIPELDRKAVIGARTTVKEGYRPFRVLRLKEKT